MERRGEVCGAVTGALMLIGLKSGNITAADRTAKEKTYTLVEEFTTRFRVRHETILCRELLGCELNTPEGIQQAKERQFFTKVCTWAVQDAAEIVSECCKIQPHPEGWQGTWTDSYLYWYLSRNRYGT